jgi:DNA-binding NtrC family response regulator
MRGLGTVVRRLPDSLRVGWNKRSENVMTSETPLRVLVVDDELLIRWALTEMLRAHGHSVVQANTGAEALRTLRETPSPMDVVLLDLRLPDSDGLGLLETIRRQSPGSAVVMMTAHGSQETATDARALGAYDVMAKPFDLDDVEPVLVKAHHAHVRHLPSSDASFVPR